MWRSKYNCSVGLMWSGCKTCRWDSGQSWEGKKTENFPGVCPCLLPASFQTIMGVVTAPFKRLSRGDQQGRFCRPSMLGLLIFRTLWKLGHYMIQDVLSGYGPLPLWPPLWQLHVEQFFWCVCRELQLQSSSCRGTYCVHPWIVLVLWSPLSAMHWINLPSW